jgi:hypothetical protein
MKERWKFEVLDIELPPERASINRFEKQFFKLKRALTWQFYTRIAKRWFIPCTKCQETIEKEYSSYMRNGFFGDTTQLPMMIFATRLCKECKKEMIENAVDADEVIMGNKDYEPTLELSRRWLDDEDSRTRISKEDYDKRNDNAKPI